MPLFEFRCNHCNTVTEVFTRGLTASEPKPHCTRCGSKSTTKLISRVSFRVSERARYSEEFLHRAKPFLKAQTPEFFTDAKGSDDSKTFRLAERIGEHIDQRLTRVASRVSRSRSRV